MARGFTRYLTAFTAQASASIGADADSTGTTTDFDTSASGNLDGCEQAEIEIDVTVAPTTATQCKVYLEALQHDGVGYIAQKSLGVIPITTTADKYKLNANINTEKGKIILHAIGFSFTASASMKGYYPSDT